MCDGVYQLALKFSPMKPGGTGYRLLFIKRTFSPWMVIDEFYQRPCHVTLGSNVTKLHFALERKPCTSYQTYFSFPSPAPFPPRMRTRKNTDGLRDYPDPSLFNRMCEGEGRVWANSRPSHGPRLECEERC